MKKINLNIQKRFSLLLLIALILAPFSADLQAKKKTSSDDAKALFNKVYNLVYGPQGSSFSYNVNIIGIYKTAGNIVYKGKKTKYTESRASTWQDGVTAYMVDHKKKAVNIYRQDDDRKDKYLSKFKFDINNYDYSYKTAGDYYFITAKVKGHVFFGVREMEAKVLKKNLYPVSLTVKLAFMKTTVYITNFHSGNINDNVFVFPKKQFQNYQFTDHRND